MGKIWTLPPSLHFSKILKTKFSPFTTERVPTRVVLRENQNIAGGGGLTDTDTRDIEEPTEASEKKIPDISLTNKSIYQNDEGIFLTLFILGQRKL